MPTAKDVEVAWRVHHFFLGSDSQYALSSTALLVGRSLAFTDPKSTYSLTEGLSWPVRASSVPLSMHLSACASFPGITYGSLVLSTFCQPFPSSIHQGS